MNTKQRILQYLESRPNIHKLIGYDFVALTSAIGTRKLVYYSDGYENFLTVIRQIENENKSRRAAF
jgi:hypothetical protein